MDSKKKAMLFLLFTTSFWGGNFVVGKVVVNLVPPFIMSFSRWAVALVILIPLLNRVGWPKKELLIKHWKSLIVMGISGVFGFNSLVYFAVKHTTPVNAALVNGLTPIVIIILSTIFLADKLSLNQLLGILLSFVGVIIVISQGTIETLTDFQFNAGDLIMLIAVVLWGIYSILMKKLTVHMSSLAITTYSAIIGWTLLIPFAVWEYFSISSIQFNFTSITRLLYIGIFASVLAFLGWNEGVIHLGPSKASVFVNLIPVFAAIFSFIFLHEKLLLHQLLGGALVVMGVLTTNYRDLLKSKLLNKQTVKM